jgi:quercetin dioxygenase-like cupin family protein
MAVIRFADLDLRQITMDGVRATDKAVVIGESQGWDGYTLRVFRIAPGGFTPHHQHDWEHVNYVIKGKGTLTLEDQTVEVTEKDFAFVPPNAMHQFKNPFDEEFMFVCIVPNRGA